MPDLSARAVMERELMDAPDVDLQALHRTYEQFHLVNRVVAGWRGVYRRELRPRARRAPLRVLDIGCGGADVARTLLRWARRDRLDIAVLGIDPDARAIDWASRAPTVPALRLRRAHSADIAGETFDVVLSNHVLHHLDAGQLGGLLADSVRLVRPGGLVLHSDLERSRAGYLAFAAATWPLRSNVLAGSFIRADGLTSIRRAYTAAELAAVLPQGWAVRRAVPSRLHVRWEAADA